MNNLYEILTLIIFVLVAYCINLQRKTLSSHESLSRHIYKNLSDLQKEIELNKQSIKLQQETIEALKTLNKKDET